MRPTTATIRSDSPRHGDWLRVFGTSCVRIKGPLSTPARVPGLGIVEVYALDVPSLTAEQRTRLIDDICERFGEARSEVERLIDDPEHGVPLLAADVTVAVDARAFL
jgi:hypothetical protein